VAIQFFFAVLSSCSCTLVYFTSAVNVTIQCILNTAGTQQCKENICDWNWLWLWLWLLACCIRLLQCCAGRRTKSDNWQVVTSVDCNSPCSQQYDRGLLQFCILSCIGSMYMREGHTCLVSWYSAAYVIKLYRYMMDFCQLASNMS